MTEDELLQRRVLEELEYDPKIDAARIGITAKGGVVTLTGEVASLAERAAAEEAARRVKGVRAIAQEVEVRVPHEKHRSDTDIAERALRILDWDVTVPHERLAVEVAKGWVTLGGEVDWGYQRTAAEDAVRMLSGVRGLTNLITVRPATKAADVRHRIEEAFRRNAELEAGRVEVEATGGRVVLTGRVETWHERDLAEDAAWNAPGVTAVEDRIVIAP
jgi:osmotically-inducible protein OsmY